jgi:hypothetical protein
MKRLLTVEDTFLVRDRGLVVVPAPPMAEVRGPGQLAVELRFADGSRRKATVTLSRMFGTPKPDVLRWGCMFKSLQKTDVPIGTEVWCDDDAFLPVG